MLRVIVLTSGTGRLAVNCLPELVALPNVQVVGVVRSQGMSPATAARRRRKKLKKIFQIGLLGAANGLRIRRWFAASHPNLESVCADSRVPLRNTPFIGSPETVDLFRRSEPDLGLSLGNSYIPKKVFSIPQHGMLNVHNERLPEYQNAQSVIWPIYNEETLTGTTIHQVAERIDQGDILYQETFAIKFRPTLEETVRVTLTETRSRSAKAVNHVCANFFDLRAAAIKQSDGCRYTTPSFRQFMRMCRNNARLYRASTAGD